MSDTAAVELPPPPPQDAGSAIVTSAELLWPAPATVEVTQRGARVGAGERVVREHLLAPRAARPRLVVPAGAPRAGAAIVSRRHASGGLAGRLASAGAAAFVRAGLADWVVRDRLRVTAPTGARVDDVETRLSEILGTRIIVGLHVGTARVNRKPVLHAVDLSGRTQAFVKVGHTESARELVRGEAATLRELSKETFTTMQVPMVLALNAWRDMELLVLSPLVGRSVRPAVRNAPLTAMRELSSVHGLATTALADSAFLARLAAIAPTLRAEVANRYATALDRIRASSVTLSFGSWHGDWQPFNMAQLNHEHVAVWDWERFATGVPVGFDALHYFLQVLLQRDGVGEQVATQFLDGATDMAVRGGADQDSAAVVVASYIAEIAGRYLALAEGPDGELLARRAHWTLGLLESSVARL